MRRSVIVVSVVLALIFLLSSCVKPVPPVETTDLRGVVMTDGKNDGVVRLLSTSDSLIGEESVYRLGGFFYESAVLLPKSFLIEASITFGEMELDYYCEVSDLEPDEIVYIGPISTLIHKYHLIYPEKSLKAIRDEVLIFLSIDPGQSDYTISMNRKRFSIANFMNSALAHGGFDSFIDFLIDDLSIGGGPHDFGDFEEDPGASIFESLMGELNENLESAAIDYATGWIFDMIGGGNGDNPEADCLLQNISGSSSDYMN